MRDGLDNEKEENELYENTDDIFSLIDNFNDENKENNKQETDAENYDDYDSIESDEDNTDEDLLSLLDMISAQDGSSTSYDDLNQDLNLTAATEESVSSNSENSKSTVNTKADEIGTEPLMDENLLDIKEILDHEPVKESEKYSAGNNPNDVGGIFSDVLSAVDTLDDKELDDILKNETKAESAKQAQKLEPQNIEKKQKENKQKDKIGFFQKIFGKGKKTETAEEEDIAKQNITNKDTSSNQKQKPIKEDKKKAAKAKKSEVKSVGAGEGEAKDKNIAKQAVKKSKAAKKVNATKESKKVKKKKSEIVSQEITDNEEIVKINKLAVIFVMTFFILLGGFVIIGTNLYSYSLDIKNANVEFSRQRYDNAYNEIYGLDIRKSDKVIYNKIMTVMFVNKELNSYKNYYKMKKYEYALDSLLKGLKRYDKYIARAKELGIESDMDYVKAQILSKLKDKFNISEEEAKALISNTNQVQYSVNVINKVVENRN